MNKKLLICITGPPGSGKSQFASVARKIGIYTTSMGDLVREETEKIFGRVDKDTVAKTALLLREKYGGNAIARLLRNKIEKIDDKIAVIDGVRSPQEVHELSKVGKTILITIIASRETRFNRLKKRGRIDDIMTIDEFIDRENREISLGLSEVINMSDLYVYNEEITIDELNNIAERIFLEIMKNHNIRIGNEEIREAEKR